MKESERWHAKLPAAPGACKEEVFVGIKKIRKVMTEGGAMPMLRQRHC